MSNSPNHRFVLLRKSAKHTCPQCGARKSFRRYVDTQNGNAELADDCGICDHVNRCGYHYPPRDYFREHPELRKDWLKEHEPGKDWALTNGTKSVTTNADGITDGVSVVDVTKLEPEKFTIPWSFVEAQRGIPSVLTDWLKEVAVTHGIATELFLRVCSDYQLGGTGRMGAVVFWQIDQEGRVRSGKVMEYLPNGHRTGIPRWMHDGMVAKELLPKGWQLCQCLYGEHLLPRYPTLPVGLVESEKTALVCSLFFPGMLWLASGGCGQLNPDKLEPLKGRKVYVFPDSGTFMKWKLILLRAKDIVADIVSTLELCPGNTDLADILLGEVQASLPRMLAKLL